MCTGKLAAIICSIVVAFWDTQLNNLVLETVSVLGKQKSTVFTYFISPALYFGPKSGAPPL